MDKKTEGVEIRRVADRNFVNSYEVFHGRKIHEFYALVIDDHFVLMEGIDDYVLGVCDYGGRSGQNNETINLNIGSANARLLNTARDFAREYARVNGNLPIRDLSNIEDKLNLQLVDFLVTALHW